MAIAKAKPANAATLSLWNAALMFKPPTRTNAREDAPLRSVGLDASMAPEGSRAEENLKEPGNAPFLSGGGLNRLSLRFDRHLFALGAGSSVN